MFRFDVDKKSSTMCFSSLQIVHQVNRELVMVKYYSNILHTLLFLQQFVESWN